MRLLYTAILYLLAPFVLLRLVWLGFKNRDYWSRWTERFGFISSTIYKRPIIWVHAVSVGEVQAATPVINRLLSEYPQYQILVTTVTPTGAAMVNQQFGDNVIHYYLPYDLPRAVNRFLAILKPVVLIVMETELWPNLFFQCNQNSIPILLVNARMSRQSFLGYKRFSIITRHVLSNVSMIAAQTEDDGNRLITLGADPSRIVVTGSLKFDVNIPHSIVEEAQSIRRYFSVNRPIWIAASTHEGEEKSILIAHRKILQTHKDCLLIIAPRHQERFANVAELSLKNGFRTICKTEAAEFSNDIEVYILDTLGELLVYYAASDVAFVGGSLQPFGGHNVLEPASVGIPIITGQYVHNFMEINRLLVDIGAELQISSTTELTEKVGSLLSDGNLRHQMGQLGKQVVARNKGSTMRVMDIIIENLMV